MRVLIVGCGYIGLPLGAKLVEQGHDVTGFGRSIESRPNIADAGILPINADVTQLASLPKITTPFDWVVNCVSSSHGGPESYRNVYLQGTRNLIDWLKPHPPHKFLYTSSTGVYGQDDGTLVKENHETAPATETGKILVETEQLLRGAHSNEDVPSIILRIAGIYGPERTFLLRRFINGEARIEGEGRRHLNMIHQDDVVGAIIAALNVGKPGEIYNAVDDEPVPQLHFYRWLAKTLAMKMPQAASPEELKTKKRGVTDKQVSNCRLRTELGYQFKYPTFRHGYSAEIKRLEDAGVLV